MMYRSYPFASYITFTDLLLILQYYIYFLFFFCFCFILLLNISIISFFFFLNDPAPPEIYPLPLHDALPICNNKVCYIEIPSAGVTQTLPTVSIAATDASAAEANKDPGVFPFTRSGSTAAALTVNYTISEIGRAHV